VYIQKKYRKTFKILFASVPVNNKLTSNRLLNMFRKTGFLINKKGYRNPRVFQSKLCRLLERGYRYLQDNIKTVILGNLCLKVICTSSEGPYEFRFVQTFYEAECYSKATFCNSFCGTVCGGTSIHC
jgi:hypothetical protein